MYNSGNPRPGTIDQRAQPQCPFFNHAAAICQAALTPRTPPRKTRAAACGCGDFEDCTTYLVRLLNRPLARHR